MKILEQLEEQINTAQANAGILSDAIEYVRLTSDSITGECTQRLMPSILDALITVSNRAEKDLESFWDIHKTLTEKLSA